MIINKLRQKLSNRFIRNMGWLGGAELVNRFFRLGTTVTLARMLNSYEYGLIAIVVTVFDFASAFMKSSSKIIQANEKDLEDLCNTSYWLNWLLNGLLFIIQCAAAFPIAWFYKDNQLILPICAVALSYLATPIYEIQYSLIQRENRFNIIALCTAMQSLILNIFTVSLALLGAGIWSVVLPYLLSPIIWISIILKNHPWRPTVAFTLDRWQEIVGFSTSIISIDLLNKLRANIDYIIIGRFIGVNALGIYYFAFNAGLGISLNVMNIIVSSLFPHLCANRDDFKKLKAQYFGSFKAITLIVFPLVILQSGLAHFYVPLIFGQKWIPTIPILILICLSALPRPYAEAANLLLFAVDKSRIALYWNLIFTVSFGISLLLVVHWGIFWVAATVLITHVLVLPLFTAWASRYVFVKKLPVSLTE